MTDIATFTYPTDAEEKARYVDYLSRLYTTPMGNALLQSLGKARRDGAIPAIQLAYDAQFADGLAYCKKDNSSLTIAMRKHIEEGVDIPLSLPLAVSTLFHEARHALQPRGGINTRVSYMQTYALFVNIVAECDAFATQFAFALDSRDAGIYSATVDYITRDMDQAKKDQLAAITDRWHDSAAPAHKDAVMAELFWFMHDGSYLNDYDVRIIQTTKDYMVSGGFYPETPPAGARERTDSVGTAFKNLENTCLGYFLATQKLPSLTGGRDGGYLGDDHPALVTRILDRAMDAQRRDVSIQRSPRIDPKTVFKAG